MDISVAEHWLALTWASKGLVMKVFKTRAGRWQYNIGLIANEALNDVEAVRERGRKLGDAMWAAVVAEVGLDELANCGHGYLLSGDELRELLVGEGVCDSILVACLFVVFGLMWLVKVVWFSHLVVLGLLQIIVKLLVQDVAKCIGVIFAVHSSRLKDS